MIVTKRDGRKVSFDEVYIVNAITRAMKNTKGSVDKTLAKSIAADIKSIDADMDVEEIQDIVEDKLMNSNRKDVAKAYIGYRRLRNEERAKKSFLDRVISELTELNPDKVNENANKDGRVFSVQRDLLAGAAAKDYALRNLLPPKISKAHQSGKIHWHDLDYSPLFNMYNCSLIDFVGMLEDGFVMGNAEIESPKSISTAANLVAQIVANTSSNMYGGTSFHRADEALEPYAKMSFVKELIGCLEDVDIVKTQAELEKEYGDLIPSNEKLEALGDPFKAAVRRCEKLIYDAMQSLEYELNTLYNSNGQTPFFTINFGLGESWFSRELQKAILKVRLCGLGKSHKTAVFPKLVFTHKKGLNFSKEDPNYDIKELALECSVKRIYPDILSYDKIVELYGYFISPMGCRSFLSYYEVNGEEMTYGRRNIGVVTLNLPRIAIEAKGNLDKFKEILDERLQICKDALMLRVESINKAKAFNAPILYMYGATGHRLNFDDAVSDIFKNGEATLSLGWIGMYETMTSLFNDPEWEKNDEIKRYSLEILKYLDDTCDKWREETGYAFSVYGTPSESLTDRFCNLDKKEFGDIKDITDKGYYTNSHHYDVRKKIDPFAKIDFEKDYTPYTLGGHICYVEVTSLIKNIEAMEAIWNYAYDKVPYFGVNSPIDKCYECGYEGEFKSTDKGFECPNCNNSNPVTTSCIRRLCGYLGSMTQRPPVVGRKKEIQSRVKHNE